MLPSGKSKASYYLRFSISNTPGVLSKISRILSKFKVSIASLTQSDINNNNCAQIIIITHKTYRENLKKL
ncbi:MAG: ACT domain-containing protein [Endomicrobium sp.]|nr:ACT domain-containing protein [Endomicrobium sp.]